MENKNFFNQLVDKLSTALPLDPKQVTTDLQQHIREILQAQFSKLDLVTREELEIQSKVLARTRQKLEQLEKKISQLEQKK